MTCRSRVLAQGGSRRLLAPRELLRDSGAAQAPSSSALSSLLGNSMGASSGEQMYMVVGFEVMACSIARQPGQKPSDVSCIDTLEGKPPAPQEVNKGMARAGTPLTLLSCPPCIPCMLQHITRPLQWSFWHGALIHYERPAGPL